VEEPDRVRTRSSSDVDETPEDSLAGDPEVGESGRALPRAGGLEPIDAKAWYSQKSRGRQSIFGEPFRREF
jgi:hypothetical protein